MRRALVSLTLLAAACGRTELDRGDPGVVPAAGGGQMAGGGQAGSSARGGSGGQAGSSARGGSGGQAGGGGLAGNSGANGRGGTGGPSLPDAGVVQGSCREIQNAGLSTGDGIYLIRVGAGLAV